jgi:hypothetical protein
MTLILAMQHADWVAMASDRLLSIEAGQTRATDAIKSVLYFNDMVFGYTGFAQLPLLGNGIVDTAKWLTKILAVLPERSIPAAVESICNHAQWAHDRIYRTNPRLRPTRGAFIGVGWERDEEAPATIGYTSIAVVSNFYCQGPDGRFSQGEPRDQFSWGIGRERIGGIHHAASGVGQFVTPRELIDWQSRANVLYGQGVRLPADYVRLMVGTIRGVSKRLKGKGVGQDVLVAVLPRAAATSEVVVASAPQAHATFVFTNEKRFLHAIPKSTPRAEFFRFAPGGDRGAYTFPNLVAPGFAYSDIVERPRSGISLTGQVLEDLETGKVIALANTNIRNQLPRTKRNRKRGR